MREERGGMEGRRPVGEEERTDEDGEKLNIRGPFQTLTHTNILSYVFWKDPIDTAQRNR